MTISKTGRTELFKHQVEGVEFLKKKKHAILADEMGLGKTRQAILAAGEDSKGAILIVCPASLKINWKREIRMVYEDNTLVISGGLSAFGDDGAHAYKNAAWVIINYDILDKHKEWLMEEIKAGRIETVIFDEAHYVKDTKAVRTKAALAIAEHAKRIYCLTGTPVMNRPIELFALLRAVKHPLAYKDGVAISTLRKAYGKRYCGAYFHRLGFTGRGFWDETGATRLPELREMTKDVFLRRMKADVLDLPEKIVSVVPCELNEEDQERYDNAWKEYLEWLAAHPEENKDLGGVLSAQALIELGKLKQVCSRAKVTRIAADVENAVAQGQKVIIFSQYTKTIAALQDEILGAVTLTGEHDAQERDAAVQAFQNDPATTVFIANMKAGGVGITLTAASIVIFADMDWSPETHRQAEDRAHRIGQSGTVNVYYYIAENTIEEDVIDILTEKQETIGVLTGGETTIPVFMESLQKRVSKEA